MQCQMICKNCSGKYHGYRTCTQPVNLGTMMQLFMDFSMQQFLKLSNKGTIEANRDWMQWIKNIPQLNLETTAEAPITQEATNIEKTSESPEKSLKRKKREQSVSKSNSFSDSMQTIKKKCIRNCGNKNEVGRDDKTIEDYSSSTDNSGSTESSEEENETTQKSKNTKNYKINKRKAEQCGKNTKNSGNDNMTMNQANSLDIGTLGAILNLTKPTVSKQQQQEANPEVNSTTAISLILGHLLQNALGGLNNNSS